MISDVATLVCSAFLMVTRVASRTGEDFVIDRDLFVAGHARGGRGGHVVNLIVHDTYCSLVCCCTLVKGIQKDVVSEP